MLIALWELIPVELKICPKCKVKLTLQNLDIHHKDGRRSNNKPENLEPMCSKCHRGALKRSTDFMINTSFRLTGDELYYLEEEAEKEGISVSAMIRRSIDNFRKTQDQKSDQVS